MNYNNDSEKSDVAVRLVSILEDIQSCNSGATAETAPAIYECFEPIIKRLAELLNAFINFQSIIVAVLELLCKVVQNLNYISTHSVYETCIGVIQTYVKHKGNCVSLEKTAEEDSLEDLLLLLKMLHHLMSKNFFDDSEESESTTVDAAEVCVFGFQHVMPLITMDLLKYPELCLTYYQTITFFIESKSHKVIYIHIRKL